MALYELPSKPSLNLLWKCSLSLKLYPFRKIRVTKEKTERGRSFIRHCCYNLSQTHSYTAALEISQLLHILKFGRPHLFVVGPYMIHDEVRRLNNLRPAFLYCKRVVFL